MEGGVNGGRVRYEDGLKEVFVGLLIGVFVLGLVYGVLYGGVR